MAANREARKQALRGALITGSVLSFIPAFALVQSAGTPVSQAATTSTQAAVPAASAVPRTSQTAPATAPSTQQTTPSNTAGMGRMGRTRAS